MADIVIDQVGANAFGVQELADHFCFTEFGARTAMFNLLGGILLIYAFILRDTFFVIMDMPFARSMPGVDRNAPIMLFGSFALALQQAVLITTISIVSGLRILASVGDIYDIIETSVGLFIILAVDDVMLPSIRCVVCFALACGP